MDFQSLDKLDRQRNRYRYLRSLRIRSLSMRFCLYTSVIPTIRGLAIRRERFPPLLVCIRVYPFLQIHVHQPGCCQGCESTGRAKCPGNCESSIRYIFPSVIFDFIQY